MFVIEVRYLVPSITVQKLKVLLCCFSKHVA
jgi:hypothetical protein